MSGFSCRRLPHLYAPGQPLFLTWRLAGSLPSNRAFPAGAIGGRAFVALDSLLDRATAGPLHLRIPEIAKPTVDAILYGERQMRLYELHAFVVMPNHVHLLITPRVQVPRITQSLKRFTARAANEVLGTTGRPFSQD
jgi:putative transposase